MIPVSGLVPANSESQCLKVRPDTDVEVMKVKAELK